MPHCGDCGAHYTSVDEFCPSCGAETGASPSAPADTTGGTSDQTAYFIGVVLGVLAVVFAPYLFFLVAIPEAIAKLFGTTLQKNFPGGARTNDYISGSMLILGWFGNFLLFVGVLLGLAIVVLLLV